MEQPIVITNREELIFMLCEAAQLEHMLLCEYLFAAFSLKCGTDEGLTAAQMEAVTRWERVVSAVAAQEMLHLTLVNNLLTAVGGAPYLTRPNFPQRAKYFPPGVQMALLPFGEHALRHFLYLERPEGMALEDAPEFAMVGSPEPVMPDGAIVPALEEFATVGHLYRGIEHGLQALSERYGERGLFIGPARAQATAHYFGWPELIAIRDLASALKAIETIVEEGEGSRGDWSQSHYGKFLKVFEEYMGLKGQDPGFAPARPVMACVVRAPADVDEGTLIADPTTAGVADLFNASYEVMLQVLSRFFLHVEETPPELQTLSRASRQMMLAVIKPLGCLLTRLPMGTGYAGMTAGPSFEIYRTGYLLPHRDAAWIVLQERLRELAGRCDMLAENHGIAQEMANAGAQLRSLADSLARHVDGGHKPVAQADGDGPAAQAHADRVANSTTGGKTMASFAQDIRPLFRDKDIQSMSWAFDLGDYEQAKTHAEGVYARLSDGSMPCDGAWPADHIALFKQWVDAGCPA